MLSEAFLRGFSTKNALQKHFQYKLWEDLLNVYKNQQKDSGQKGSQQNKSAKNESQNKENVVDADFEEVKEDKKEDKSDKDKEKRA